MEEREEVQAFSVRVFSLQEEQQQELHVCRLRDDQELTLLLNTGPGAPRLTVQDENRASILQFFVSKETDCCQVGNQSFLVAIGNLSVLLQFQSPSEMQNFQRLLKRGGDEGSRRGRKEGDRRGKEAAERGQVASVHPNTSEPKTEESATQSLQLQQGLLQDYLRTATYQRAILLNETDFRDKVVLDVCCGSGILSFFAVQAGARRVYAVDCSPMAQHAQVLVRSNGLSDRILVLEGDMRDVVCPDAVDVIVSEPMGYMLLNERVVDSFLYARKWLKPNGLMFPSCADIHLAPFSDEQLYMENHARAAFWQQRSFCGVNLNALHGAAVAEFLTQPIVDIFDVQILMAKSVKHRIDFLQTREEEVLRIEIPFVFPLLQSGLVHGLAFWFDVAYLGSRASVWFSTAPSEPVTRWYQVRCLLQTPLFAKLGQTLSGSVLLAANNRQNFDIFITATVDQSGFRSANTLDLKNPVFRMPSWLHG
ncbi:hypothetical protein LDENG_00182050 [Lucifuga dentata]|nr:hypothetical protein LDENG_00182050 [Lucifuga dentata]